MKQLLWRQPVWIQISLLVLAWRLVLFGLAFLAPSFLLFKPSYPYATTLLEQPLPPWVSTWAGFDGVHYLTLAEKGYVGTGLIQAFFPVFPGLVSLLSTELHPPILAGIVVNFFLTCLAMLLAWKLLALDIGEKRAWAGVVAILLFPTSLFLGALYSEALFLTLSVGAILAIRKNHWLLASVLIGIASATRITGIFLLLILVWEWGSGHKWIASKLIKQLPQLGLWLFIGSVGLIAFMFYLWKTFDDPLYFLHVQSEFGAGRSESIITYPQVIWRYTKMIATVRPIDWKFFTLCCEFLAGLLPMLALLKWWRSVRPSYLWYGMASFILPTVTGTFSSLPRYLLLIWPIFFGLAVWSQKNKATFNLYLLFSTILLIINTMLFIQGYWVA